MRNRLDDRTGIVGIPPQDGRVSQEKSNEAWEMPRSSRVGHTGFTSLRRQLVPLYCSGFHWRPL